MKLCVDLRSKKLYPENFGNKAYNLNKALGFARIPNGFVVTAYAYDFFINSNNLTETIKMHLLSLYNKKDNIKKVSKLLMAAILNSKMPVELEMELRSYADRFNAPFAVRSSSTIEDSEKASFAGLFETILNVRKKDLENSIKRIFASLFTEKVLLYAINKHIYLNKFRMPILIQEMVDGEKFGIGFMFKHYQKKIILIESSIGDPEGVTGGKDIPDLYIIKNNRIEKYPAQLGISHLFQFEISGLVNLIKKIEPFMFPIDIEWAIKGQKIYLLQLRYLTEKIKISTISSKPGFGGLPAYPGKQRGRAVILNLRNKGYVNKIKGGKNKILITNFIQLDKVDVIRKFGGVIVESSGITSHIAIFAREYKIPCIVGVINATRLIHNNDLVYMNGDTGEISLQKKQKIPTNHKYIPITFDIKKMKLFRYKNDAVILYPEKNRLIVSYYYNGPDCNILDFHTTRLKSILNKIIKQYKTVCVDGGERLRDCIPILEFVGIDGNIRKIFNSCTKLMNTADMIKTEKKLREVINTGMELMGESKDQYKKYEKIKDKKMLALALSLFYKGFVYWSISNFGMLEIVAEHMIINMKGVQKEKFEEFIKKIWGHVPDTRVKPKDIEPIMSNIYNAIASDLNIYLMSFTSYAGYLKAVEKACNIQ